MRQVSLSLLVIILVTCGAHAENQTPSRSRCDADFKTIQALDDKAEDTVKLSQLADWVAEFRACSKAYPTTDRRYLGAMGVASSIIGERQRSFLERRGLYSDFLKEDSHGKDASRPGVDIDYGTPSKGLCDSDVVTLTSSAGKKAKTVPQLVDVVNELDRCDDAYAPADGRYKILTVGIGMEICYRVNEYVKRHGLEIDFSKDNEAVKQ